MIERSGSLALEFLDPAAALYDRLERYLAVPGIVVVREEHLPDQAGYSSSRRRIALDQSLAGDEAARVLCRETTKFYVDHLVPDLSLADAELVSSGAAHLILAHHGLLDEEGFQQWAHASAEELSPLLGRVQQVAQRMLTELEALAVE